MLYICAIALVCVCACVSCCRRLCVLAHVLPCNAHKHSKKVYGSDPAAAEGSIRVQPPTPLRFLLPRSLSLSLSHTQTCGKRAASGFVVFDFFDEFCNTFHFTVLTFGLANTHNTHSIIKYSCMCFLQTSRLIALPHGSIREILRMSAPTCWLRL